MSSGVDELRVVLTVEDFQSSLSVLRDVLGMEVVAQFDDGGGPVVLLSAGRATIELSDRAHSDHIDGLEVGRTVPVPVRLAVHVPDTETATAALIAAGLTLLGPPAATPWGSINSRVVGPAGVQLTLFDGVEDDDA